MDDKAEFFQHAQQHGPADGIVVDHQDTAQGVGLGDGEGGGGRGEMEGKTEAGAVADGAFQGDPAAHQLHQFAADGQTEPGYRRTCGVIEASTWVKT